MGTTPVIHPKATHMCYMCGTIIFDLEGLPN